MPKSSRCWLDLLRLLRPCSGRSPHAPCRSLRRLVLVCRTRARRHIFNTPACPLHSRIRSAEPASLGQDMLVEDLHQLALLGRSRIMDVVSDQDGTQARHGHVARIKARLEIRLIVHCCGQRRCVRRRCQCSRLLIQKRYWRQAGAT